MSDRTTFGIRIQVGTRYVPERSRSNLWLYEYTVRITNQGEHPAQLLSRHWIIENAFAQREEVRGPGVVGETPRLEPGDVFVYTSFCPLSTPTGQMYGSYQMVFDDGEEFDAIVDPFHLTLPSEYTH